MKRIWIVTLSLVLLGACSSDASPSSFVLQQLDRKASRQAGPKTLLTTGKAPNGLPYVLDVYRIDDGRICIEHAWQFANGYNALGTCPDNPIRKTFHNISTYPGHDDSPRDETPWVMGLVVDAGKAVTLRGTRGARTQEFALIRSDAYPGLAFYIGRTEIAELFETVQLLDADDRVIASAPFVQA